ncbi:MAG: hypothetical protein JRI36_01720 [Deltaproteobacteria bacterium]|nr:hypothetical protein [Deltaproteobacteria bacterium]
MRARPESDTTAPGGREACSVRQLRASCRSLAGYMAARYLKAAEIGVGAFPDVALALVGSGLRVFATDIVPYQYRGLKVVIDDVTAPALALYTGLDVIYSVRPPPELIPYLRQLAGKVSADLIVKPLSGEFPSGGHLTGRADSAFFLWAH